MAKKLVEKVLEKAVGKPVKPAPKVKAESLKAKEAVDTVSVKLESLKSIAHTRGENQFCEIDGKTYTVYQDGVVEIA